MAALDHKTENTALPRPSTSNASVPSEDKYDAMYFDSDDEDEGTAKSRWVIHCWLVRESISNENVVAKKFTQRRLTGRS